MNKDIAWAQGAQTKCIHAAREFNRTSAISPPIWQTSTFLAESSEHFAALAKSVAHASGNIVPARADGGYGKQA